MCEIRSLDVGALAKLLGVMGLIWGVIVAVALLVAGLAGTGFVGRPEIVGSAGGGAVYSVVGLITAIVYNAAASLIGGVRIELA